MLLAALLPLAVLLTALPGEAHAAVPLDDASTPEQASIQVEVTLVGGQTVSGLVPADDYAAWDLGEPITVSLPGGSQMVLTGESVLGVSALTPRAPGEFSWENPAASRYLYAPSAIPLRQNEGYISQKELIFTSAAVGVTDHITLLLSMPVPVNIFLLSNGEGPIIVGGLKASGQLAPDIHVGVGGEALIVLGEAVGIGFVNATLGDRDSNLTVGLGLPVNLQVIDIDNGFFFAIAGQHRVSDRVALISENWWLAVPDYFGDLGVFSGGVRLLREDITVDLALLVTGGGGQFLFVPVPWVDFAWHFGG